MGAAHSRLTSSNCCGCMENSVRPRPSSSRVMRESPAISPQTATGLPARSPALMVFATRRSTAGCSGSYRDATSWSPRSIASVYWIRSLVPMERKSSAWAKARWRWRWPAPRPWRPLPYGPHSLAARVEFAPRGLDGALVATTSCIWAIIGISSRTGLWAEARRMAQLRGEHLGARQAVADGALAQRGVGGHRGLAVQRLVRADVQRADGDGTARHYLHHRGIGFVLLFLARQVRAAHEQELAAEQADAVRAGRQRQRGLLGQFDIGVQHHVDAVQRDRGHVAQQAQLGALVGIGGLAAAVFLQDARRGIHYHGARRAVDDQRVAIAHQLAHIAQATTAGTPMLRATMAVWDVGRPGR